MTTAAAARTRRAQAAPKIPFPGLDAFTPEDAPYFFGRDRNRKVITANLEASRLTLLYGASGVGKSSILMASVVRELRARAIENARTRRDPSTPARFAVAALRTWVDDPLPRLMEQIHVQASEALGDERLEPWDPREPPVERLRAWTRRVRFLYVVLDQFEEYFLYHAPSDADGTFDVEFPKMINDEELRAHFLVSLREDALALLDRFKPRIPRLYENYLRVDHLDVVAARQAIQGPVAKYNELYADDDGAVGIEDELVEELLASPELRAHRTLGADGGAVVAAADSGKPLIETPYLQLVLRRLWVTELDAGSELIRLDTLRALGGPQKIVERHLEDAINALTPAQQDVAADIFRFLVTPSKTKVAHTTGDLADFTDRDEAEIRAVLNELWRGKSWIVRRVVPPGEPGAEDESRIRYEIFHDVLAEPILAWRTRKLAERRRREETEATERALVEARAATQRERRRAVTFLVLAVLAGAAFVVAAVVGWLAVQASRTAKSERLASSAMGQLAISPDAAAQTALDALGAHRTQGAENALRIALPAARIRAVIPGHDDFVSSGALAGPGGRYAVLVGWDGRTRVWDWVGRRELAVLPKGAGDVTAIDGGRRFFTTNGEGGAVWDVSSCTGGRCRLVRNLPRAQTISADGNVVASAYGRTVRVSAVDACRAAPQCKVSARLHVPVLKDFPASATIVALSPDGSRVAAGTLFGNVVVWDGRTPTAPREFFAENRSVDSLTFSPDGSKLAAVTGKTARVWNVDACRPHTNCGPVRIARDPDFLQAVEFSPDGTRFVTAADDGTASVWRLSSPTPEVELRGHTDVVFDASFGPGGRNLITASADGTARIWDVGTGLVLHSSSAWVDSAAFSATGDRVVTAGADGMVRIYARRGPHRGEEIASGTASYAGFPVSYAEFNPKNERQVVSAGDLGYVTLWTCGGEGCDEGTDLPTGEDTSTANMAVFNADGTLVATATDSRAQILDVTRRRLLATFARGERQVLSIAFSSDGRRVVTASVDRRVRVWDVSSCHAGGTKCAPHLEQVLEHAGVVYSAVFSPDGRFVATAASDRLVRIWPLGDRHPKPMILSGSTSNVMTVAYSTDGRRLVSSGPDGVTRIWDPRNGRLLAALRMHGNAVESARFDPRDSSTILTASDDGTAKVYRCTTCGPLADVQDLAQQREALIHRRAAWLPRDAPPH